MKVLKVRNVHDALPAGLDYLEHHGVRRPSRNGSVIVAPGPVTTHYTKPRERVIFWAERDANRQPQPNLAPAHSSDSPVVECLAGRDHRIL